MFVTPGILRTSILVLVLYIVPMKSSELYRCPTGLSGTMHTHDGHCYRYMDTRVTWDAASADCSSTNGGHLVVILDQSTNNFISSLPFSSTTYQIWIGFTDKDQEQLWKWVTGASSRYDSWSLGYPELCYGGNSVCPEDCAYMRTSDGKWREDHCNNNNVKYQYVCQYDMGPTTASTTTPTTTPTTTTTTTPTTTTTTPTTTTTTPTTTTTTPSPTTKTTPTTTSTSTTTTTTTTTTSTAAASVTLTTQVTTTTQQTVVGMGQLQKEDKVLSAGGLAGLVVTLIILILLILAVLLLIIRRRNRKKRFEAEEFQVRFQNHTYDTNRLPNSFVDEQMETSNIQHTVENIYETPGPKACNGDSFHDFSYEKPVNRDTLDCMGPDPMTHDPVACKGADSYYDSMKEADMVDLPDKHYSEVDFAGCDDTQSCDASSVMSDPTYSNVPQKEASHHVVENRSNEELLRYFEEFNKAPTGYDNNLYVCDKNKSL
ncbi:uncharacterized protein [Argopecten irradians]|uniref:uncharacterized protein isoform X2 n=1 Tax=Argopecten irradians TaxID=31199 RepID=UPI003723CA31